MAEQTPSGYTQAGWSEMKEELAVSRARVLLAIERLEEIAEAKERLAEAELRRRRRWRLF